MKRFRLTYNGIVSEFNAFENGKGGTVVNNKYVTYFVRYSVRPSNTNTMKVTGLIESHNEDGSITWHFYCNTRVPRGLKVEVVEL